MASPMTSESATAQSSMTDPSGQPPSPPKIIRRRPNNSNPLVSRQPRRPPPPPGGRSGVPPGARSGVPPGGSSLTVGQPVGQPRQPQFAANAAPTPPPQITATPVKQEEVSDEGWQTFKLTTTKASLLKGLRHHVMRLQSKRQVDPLNTEEFTRPIRLHRRDPQAPLQGVKEQNAATAQAAVDSAADPEEKARLEAEQAQKDADRAAIQEKIAPYGGAAKPRQNAFKKKTQQFFQSNDKDKKLRYEEFFPWFIEDFDNKNTWQGQMESSLSGGSYAMFVLDGANFRMVPIEKWYKFTEKNRFKTLSIEEAELALKKSSKTPRWMMKLTKQDEKEQLKQEREQNMQNLSKLKTRRGDRLEGAPKAETADADDLDFDDDRFADDEEAPVMEGEEAENKEIEKRIKKEQLSANIFGLRGEREHDEEERENKKLKNLRKKQGKKVNKLLMNREGNHTYDTDSDDNPYGPSSSEEDSDDEAIRKEEERLEEEKRKKEEEAAKLAATKEAAAKKPALTMPSVNASSSTPKPTLPKKTNSANTNKPTTGTPNLKRSGSPDLSESGTDKRKKPRKIQPSANTPSSGQDKLVKLKLPAEKLEKFAQLTQTTVSQTGKKRKAGTGGAGSGDDGDMSESSKKQRIKIVSGGRALSPTASRQGSPDASRSGTPAVSANTRPGTPAAEVPVPFTDAEIRALFKSPDEGITTQAITKKNGWGSRLRIPEVKAAFVTSLKRMTITGKDKIIRLRDEYK